jgi:hypothetical protein
VRRLTHGRAGGWGARSVLLYRGLQRRPVGVECWQRHDHVPECVRPRLHTAPRCPRLRSRAGGSHSPPHPPEFTLRPQPPSAASGEGGGGASSLSRRALVPPWGSNPRPQEPLPRACGCPALEGVCWAVCGCAQCSTAPRPSTATCRRGTLAASRLCPSVRVAPPPPFPALVRAPEPGEVTLHPTHGNSLFARSRASGGGGRGGV